MNAERLQQIEQLFHAALEREAEERVAYLREVCGADESLRHEVETLLACGTKAEDVFELPAVEMAARALARDEVQPHAALPVNIGHYRIVRLLGEGGMGAVYEAEQEYPRRIVALKVIKPGLANPELLRRFEQESQVLARLQHPGIAQVYEAGTADSRFGRQPYFAMEFIRGDSLLPYAEAHQLKARQRLNLMAKVCEGVHHAHQRGIIHRDLKPGNILVDESGQPKVLDFGVARVTNSDAQATRQTDVGQLVGTLAYMSPEQVLADPLELDMRSDVYALGVILFELLAGCLPYKISGQLHEAVRTIREEDPVPLSSISRAYRGDIETIVAKALEKDKSRRYASAASLAGDIRRYLDDEPIIARPASATYQLQKFARRHKTLVAGIAAVFVVLIAGIVASTWEAARARRAEQAATAVNDFLQNDLLAQASANAQARPDTRPDPDLKVRTALDRAAARIEGKFKQQPVIEASIRQTIGNTYSDLGLYPDAQRQMERALDLRRRVLGQEHPNTLATMESLGVLYHHQGKNSQAEPLLTNVLGIRRRLLGEEHPDTLETMDDLSSVYHDNGNLTKAEPLLTKVLSARRRVLGSEHPNTLITMNNLASVYRDQGKLAQAEALFTEALQVKRRVLGEEHPSTLMAMNNLAVLYKFEGRYAQAEPLLAKVFELRRHTLGDEHPDTLITMNELSGLYYYLGKYPQAELLITRGLDVELRILGTEHPDVLTNMNNLAGLYRDEGKYVQAEALYTRVLSVEERVQGEEHPNTLTSLSGLALLYRDLGKYAQSELLYIKVLDIQRRVLGAEHIRRLMGMNDLSLLYLYQGKYTQAEALLREALNSLQKIRNDTWIGYSTQSLLGASLAGQKKYEEAEPLALSGLQGMLQREATIPAASRFKLEQAGAWIVQLYWAWGKPEKAAVWAQKLKDAGLPVSPKKL